MTPEEVIKENTRRYSDLFAAYNPITGQSPPIEREELSFSVGPTSSASFFLPLSMFDTELIKFLNTNKSLAKAALHYYGNEGTDIQQKVFSDLIKLRFKHDFEFWAFATCKIQDKETKKLIPFKMRLAQRILFKELEDMRMAGVPIRLILLKARQYGGSTLIQIYMLWIQTELMENWHSAVCGDDEGQARNIRGMYARAAKEYPSDLGSITLVPYQGSSKNRFVKERGCIIGIGSMQKPDNLRSYDFSMLHLSEVGLWKETQSKKPEDLAQTLRSALPTLAMTMEVLESTAKGVGNFFHREWLDAKNKVSGYRAVFVPWFMIDLYVRDVDDLIEFFNSLNPHEIFMWQCGATLQGIVWYRKHKTDNRYSDWRMQSEFPTTDLEAFQSTGARVFAPHYVQQMRKTCCEPAYIGQLFAKGQKGSDALIDIDFRETPEGNLWIWGMPDKTIEIENRYIVAVDIGGRTDLADFSTVRVLDRYWEMEGGEPEMVATWKGHLDQDLFAWVAVQIAEFWNHALFIVETNSLRKEKLASEGDHYLTILDEIAEFYDNVYTRSSPQKVRGEIPNLYGLHMGQNKVLIIDSYNGALREFGYVERDARVLDEADCYEYKPDGSMGAVEGTHDDLIIPSAICVWADGSPLAIGPVKEIVHRFVQKTKIISEASIN